MILAGYVLSGLIAAGIIFIGLRFLWAPATASAGYGIAGPPAPDFNPWLAAKGLRDIVSGLFLLLLIANGVPPLLGGFLLVASLIPLGDAMIVLRSGGSRAAAFGIHGGTAIVIVAVGAILIGAAR